MKDFYVADAPRFDNTVITSFFCLAQVQVRERKQNGGSYLALTLSDKTGSFEARMWEEFADAIASCREGCYVKVQGQISSYKGKWQITLTKLRNAAESEIEASDFQPVSAIPVDEMEAELRALVAGFLDADLKELVLAFLDDPEIGPAFRVAPAAKMLHHAWISGLLEHVLTLARVCLAVAPFYPEVDPDLLLTGAILHDIGKVRELGWKTNFHYTLEGQMIGHISIAQGMLREKLVAMPGFPEKKRILIEHMLLSHHGKYEFGSPKLPMTPEAMLLNVLDDLEAKFAAMRREFAAAESAGKKADEPTEWVRSMERNLFDSRRWLADVGEPCKSPALTSAEQKGFTVPAVEAPLTPRINAKPEIAEKPDQNMVDRLRSWAGRRDLAAGASQSPPNYEAISEDLSYIKGCAGKQRYETERHADEVLQWSQHQPGFRTNDGMHSYHCSHCGGWHLGH